MSSVPIFELGDSASAVSLLLHHETSPAVALRILRQRTFEAGPILGDAGLNAELDGVSYHPGQAAARGAVLTFTWSGPVCREPVLRHEPNILYDERPHRAFVFVCTDQHLHLTGVTLREGRTWAEAVAQPERPQGWALLDPRAWNEWARAEQAGAIQRRAEAVAEEVANRLADRPAIRIVPHREACHGFILQERGLLT